MATDLPKTIGRYEIKARIDRGGAAEVFQAIDPNTNKAVALKIYPAGRTGAWVERRTAALEKARTADRPDFVQIEEIGEIEGSVYVAMEYISGGSLAKLLKRGRPALNKTLGFARKLAETMARVHADDVIHGSLSPHRILVSADLRSLKIIDAAIATEEGRASVEVTAATMMATDKINYMAFEQVRDPESIDHRVDIYSFGVVFYEMLTGGLPLGRATLPSTLHSDVPAAVDEMVLKCLTKDRDGRYASMNEVVAALDKLKQAMPARIEDEIKEFTLSATAAGIPWKLVAVGGGLVLLAAVLALLFL